MSILARFAVVCALVAPLAAGCAADADDDGAGSSTSALGSNPVYDAVISNGTKVTANATRNSTQSASTQLVGWIPNENAGKVLDQLFKVARWTEMRDPDGERPFTRADVSSDASSGGTRTLAAKITLEGGVTLEVKAVAKTAEGGKITVNITNTTKYKHWLAGTILEANKLDIDLSLVPYENGVIVEAKMAAKLSKMEDKAPALTGAIKIIFDWLKTGR